MTITDFLAELCRHPEQPLRLVRPAGGVIPAHFHITEVGHVVKNFIDCGGTRRRLETCLLQTWVADDTDHQLVAGKLATIFDRSGDLLPSHDLPVEVEYEDGTTAQFTVESASLADGVLTFQLGAKHTDCLAKELCLPGSDCCLPVTAPEVKLLPTTCCTPGSSCC